MVETISVQARADRSNNRCVCHEAFEVGLSCIYIPGPLRVMRSKKAYDHIKLVVLWIEVLQTASQSLTDNTLICNGLSSLNHCNPSFTTLSANFTSYAVTRPS